MLWHNITIGMPRYIKSIIKTFHKVNSDSSRESTIRVCVPDNLSGLLSTLEQRCGYLDESQGERDEQVRGCEEGWPLRRVARVAGVCVMGAVLMDERRRDAVQVLLQEIRGILAAIFPHVQVFAQDEVVEGAAR
ncbi:hypothetical protein CDAR_478191 [Caerostris darwini]|uniref:Uncharacterized protein n=1 Tax=Caerostris darwini TaxID=1538125 RepID=A0AAV4UKG4_9ARAC|nr:hypothetical protein CDAR_478191 [Caerostris darwini]